MNRLLKAVLQEAMQFEATASPTPAPKGDKKCSCGHPESFHDSKGCKTCRHSGDAGERVRGGHSFERIPSWNESETVTDKPEMCDDCGKKHAPSVPCPKKKLLFGDELGDGMMEMRYPDKFWDHMTDKPVSHPLFRKDDQGRHFEYVGMHRAQNFKPEYRHHDGKKLHIKHGEFGEPIHASDYDHQVKLEKHAGTEHPGFFDRNVNEAKKPKKFDKQAHVKALSRAAMGQPPSKKVIVSKKDKPPKYKERFDEASVMSSDDIRYRWSPMAVKHQEMTRNSKGAPELWPAKEVAAAKDRAAAARKKAKQETK